MKRNSLGKDGVVAILLSALLMLVAAYSVRYGLLENGFLPRDCSVPEVQGALCTFKTALVQSFLHQRMGWFSLACGALAFALGCRRIAWVGWLSGLAGLAFYSYDPAAVGALLSLLVLVRPREKNGRSKDESGEQPRDGLRVGRLG